MACYGLKKGSFHLLCTVKGLRSFGENTFLTRFRRMFDPFFVGKQPILKAKRSVLATFQRPINAAIFKGWKPPTAGGCGWIRCTRNRVLSHAAQDMVCFWFGYVGGQCAQILGLLGAFWGRFANILWI